MIHIEYYGYFYLSTDSDNKSIRLVRIKDVINSGCISPVMYIEAMNIINAQPVLLRVLNQFEMQVINYGCRNDIISESLRCRLQMLWLMRRILILILLLY